MLFQVSGSDEASTLSKLIDLIHDEFAFDGYLDDGVEDVNMGKDQKVHYSNHLKRNAKVR